MIASHPLKSLLVLSVLFYSKSASFDGCPEITTAWATEMFQKGLFGDAGNPTFTLGDRVANCLSVGRVRGLYRYATYTSEFTSNEYTGLQYLQIDIRCSPITGVWTVGSAELLVNQTYIDLLFNNDTLRTDCTLCSKTTMDSEPTTHCVGKKSLSITLLQSTCT